MKKYGIVGWIIGCMALTACSNVTQNSNTVATAKHKVNFQLPKTQQWELVSVEQDANGYAKSYRSVNAKGLAADQSFYINYGHNIKTPLLESMHEVVGSLASTGCKDTSTKILNLEKNALVFMASAEQCLSGRSIWQIFKVFNMPDGQYSIVYSGNPNVVPLRTMQQMKTVIIGAKIG